MQRLRVKFSRGEELKFISHLDLIRLWQRAVRRAGISLAYSEGFSPHPRISLAVPLAVGVTSEAELMDIFCSKWVSPHYFTTAVSQQLPAAIKIYQVYQVGETAPSLQSQVGSAEYQVLVETSKGAGEVEAAIAQLLSQEHLPWQHQRDTGMRSYDLRILIDDLRLVECRDGRCALGMRLRSDEKGSGRPEQVTAALGFDQRPLSVHRTRLILKGG